MISQEMKTWIDKADYQSLLEKWRFAPAGSPWFQGEIGQYYSKIMAEKRTQCDHVSASKAIGW